MPPARFVRLMQEEGDRLRKIEQDSLLWSKVCLRAKVLRLSNREETVKKIPVFYIALSSVSVLCCRSVRFKSQPVKTMKLRDRSRSGRVSPQGVRRCPRLSDRRASRRLSPRPTLVSRASIPCIDPWSSTGLAVKNSGCSGSRWTTPATGGSSWPGRR